MGDDMDIILDDAAPLQLRIIARTQTKPIHPVPDTVPMNLWPYSMAKRGKEPGGSQSRIIRRRYRGTSPVEFDTNPEYFHRQHIAFSQDTYSVSKTVPSAVITVTLDSTPASTVTVKYYTEPGSAIPGQDYLTSTGILTFVHSPQQTFLVPILNNPDNTSSKTLTISLHSPTYGILTTPYTAPLHIIAEKQESCLLLAFHPETLSVMT